MKKQRHPLSTHKRFPGTVLLIALVLVMAVFLFLGAHWDTSPKESWQRLIGRREIAVPEREVTEKRALSKENYGLLARLEQSETQRRRFSKEELIAAIRKAVGIYAPVAGSIPGGFLPVESISATDGIKYDVVTFVSYDGLNVPLYVLRPPDFQPNKTYPTVLLFSGHGPATQAAFDTSSYQRGAGAALARCGYVVFVMENRGMGRLEHLGDHLRIDAVARLTGGSWYGEIVTDALFLFENVVREPYVDQARVFTCGVSTGGALSMFVAALDDRVAAAYVQGFLGSFKTTFGKDAKHCLCGHLPGILEICDMTDIGSLIAPRPVCFVNGAEDSFGPTDARIAFETIKDAYVARRAGGRAVLLTPAGVGHEFSVDLALAWLDDHRR